MDTKTLVVGQDVYVFGGSYVRKGKVVKIMPLGRKILFAENQSFKPMDLAASATRSNLPSSEFNPSLSRATSASF